MKSKNTPVLRINNLSVSIFENPDGWARRAQSLTYIVDRAPCVQQPKCLPQDPMPRKRGGLWRVDISLNIMEKPVMSREKMEKSTAQEHTTVEV